MKQEIDITKKYITRDGREVTGLRDDRTDTWPIGGVVDGSYKTWSRTGGYDHDSCGENEDRLDLVPAEDPEPTPLGDPEPTPLEDLISDAQVMLDTVRSAKSPAFRKAAASSLVTLAAQIQEAL